METKPKQTQAKNRWRKAPKAKLDKIVTYNPPTTTYPQF